MRKHAFMLALLMLAIPVFAMSSYPGNYPAIGGDGDDDSNPRLRMDLHVWEDCGGIFVEAVSGGTLGDGKGIPGVFVDVIALPRDKGILLIAEGYTDESGVFTFNTSGKNFSVSASKDGYYSEQAEFAPQGVSCELSLDIVYDCAKKGALVSVMSGGEPLADAQVLVDGDDAGLTGPDGSLFVAFTGSSNVSASYGGRSAETGFAPDCPQEDGIEDAAVPPLAPPGDKAAPAAPAPPAPAIDLPLIAGAVMLAIALIYLLTRKGIGPGPMKPKGIGPGPMKSKEIGPGPMKPGEAKGEAIGPGPMKPKEIGPGPM